jgi:dipeptidyl-peptidase 4
MAESYPHQAARTRGFTLGLPRSFTVGEDGARVAFLRTSDGGSSAGSLWVLDVDQDVERIVFDPAQAGGELSITDEERDRRERAGERMTGVVTYAADPSVTLAAFALGPRLMVADLLEGSVRELDTAGAAFDPRPDPTGRRVAYVTGGTLRVIDLSDGSDSELAGDPDPDVHWAVAEFIAAEEMGRLRGYWWAPDGERLLVCRVDERALPVWHIADPIHPEASARAIRYPRAGTVNADVTLHVLGLDRSRADVTWDRRAHEYVASAGWDDRGPFTLVQSRDQRSMQVLAIDPGNGVTSVIAAERDPIWVDLTPGSPARLDDGRLVTIGHREDSNVLLVGGGEVTPPGLQVASVIDASAGVTFTGTEEPTEMHVWRWSEDGLRRLTDEPGWHAAAASGGGTVLVTETDGSATPTATLYRGDEAVHVFLSMAETPVLTSHAAFVSLGSRNLRSAVLTPEGRDPEAPLPVVLDPYGGPHFGRVMRTQRALLESQWLADQGFAVLVTDGRGTPWRGVAWDQSIYGRYVDLALEDQVEALHAAADRLGYLDLTRVGIRGWSYGGYLTLAALLRRPDVFHAGISGAPVTDMRYYDTHYTERYLGTPGENPDAYESADLIPDAEALRGDLLMIHGLSDDNVYVVHSLRMSQALMAAGRPHAVIPLSGITHRPTDPVAAERMLMIEVSFLRRALGDPGRPGPRPGNAHG